MIIIYEIPIIIVVLLVLAILAGISAVVNNIAYIVLAIVIAIIYFGMFVLLFKLFAKLYEKQKNKWFFVGFISIMLLWFLGPVNFFGLSYMDKSNVYMALFGENKLLRYLVIPLAIALIISLALLLIAHKCKGKFLQFIICVLSAVFILTFTMVSDNICAKSYSDYTVQELSKTESVRKYTVNRRAKIYYPFAKEEGYVMNGNKMTLEDSKNIIRFPIFSPIKYSTDSFDVGDTVYAKSTTSIYNREYIKVSDGEKAGFISTEALK